MNDKTINALYYRVLLSLSEITSRDESAKAVFNSFFAEGGGGDLVSGMKMNCKVDPEWIIRIEELLPEVGKAILEMRSLIKNEGQIVRIEQAKKPSKDSVIHLAKHTNLIRNVGEDGSPQPEELYITDNYDDFAVYENRFLYYLLTCLRTFIGERLEKISAGISKSGTMLSVDRNVGAKDRLFRYSLSLSELSDKGSGSAAGPARSDLERIQKILQQTDIFLSHPLMKQVSSAPRLKPPLIRTNIIKNNPHFIAAFELYSYINAYRGDGFEITEEDKKDIPLSENALGALARIAALQSYIAHLCAFDGFEGMKRDYEDSEREYISRRAASAKESVSSLKSSIEQGKLTVEEFETGTNNIIEGLLDLTERAESRIKALEHERADDRERIARLENRISALTDEIRVRDERQDIRSFKESLRESYEIRINQITAEKQAELKAAKSEWEKERALLEGRLRSRSIIAGEEIKDPCDRESFIQLEKEKDALDSYYKEQWKKTKRRIRREVLGKKPDKKQ